MHNRQKTLLSWSYSYWLVTCNSRMLHLTKHSVKNSQTKMSIFSKLHFFINLAIRFNRKLSDPIIFNHLMATTTHCGQFVYFMISSQLEFSRNLQWIGNYHAYYKSLLLWVWSGVCGLVTLNYNLKSWQLYYPPEWHRILKRSIT